MTLRSLLDLISCIQFLENFVSKNNSLSMNTITLIGYVGKDAESRTFENGNKVTSFTLATTVRGYTLQNGTQVPDQTDWHNIVCNRQHNLFFDEATDEDLVKFRDKLKRKKANVAECEKRLKILVERRNDHG